MKPINEAHPLHIYVKHIWSTKGAFLLRKFFTFAITVTLGLTALPAPAMFDPFLNAKQAMATLRQMARAGAPENAVIVSESLKSQLLTLGLVVRISEFGEKSGPRDRHMQALLKLARMHLSQEESQFLRTHFDDVLRHWMQTDAKFYQAFKDYHLSLAERAHSGLRSGLRKVPFFLFELVAMLATRGLYQPTSDDDQEMRNARTEVKVAMGIRAMLEELYPDCDDALTGPS